jgi:anti-anti-sigma factor
MTELLTQHAELKIAKRIGVILSACDRSLAPGRANVENQAANHVSYVGHWIFAEVSVEIGERRDGGILILLPTGRIDNDTSAAFQARLLASLATSGAAVLVDFTGVEYISSAGLRALMMGSRQAKAVKGRLAVADLRPVVKEIFEISRFSLVVQVFDTMAEALAALR